MNTIVIVDTDKSFLDQLNKKLREEVITDKFTLQWVVPDTTLEPPGLVRNCLSEIDSAIFGEGSVIGVFVDIVIMEGHRKLDSTGINIASELRNVHPSLPIFSITGKYSDEESETDLISEASLEDVDGVLLKSYLVGKSFSTKRLLAIFERARVKRMKYCGPSVTVHAIDIPADVKGAYNLDSLDPRVESEINEIGPVVFWSLVKKLLPGAEGTVSFVKPGRSGDSVFRVYAKFKELGLPATRPKSWIIKVSSHIEGLEQELRNYSELAKTPLPRSFYPKSLAPELAKVGSYAGFAIELEEGTSSLSER